VPRGGRQGQTVTETSRAERTATELKAAARRLLTRKSYADIRITDITEEAGRAAGSFYRYFTDKDDLLRALVADFESAVSGQVEDMLGGPDHGLADREDVRKHVEAYWTSYRTHHAEMSGLFQAAAVSDEFRSTRGSRHSAWSACSSTSATSSCITASPRSMTAPPSPRSPTSWPAASSAADRGRLATE